MQTNDNTTDSSLTPSDLETTPKTITQQQIIFYLALKKLNYLKEKKKQGTLTSAESFEYDQITEDLLKEVYRYGAKTARQMTFGYALPNDFFADIMQSIAAQFFEILPRYDATRYSITTFCKRYFEQEIHQYIRDYSQHLSQYDSQNITKVRRAIASLEAANREVTEERLSAMTDLSILVVRKTLILAENSTMADVSDLPNLKDNTPTPEEACLKLDFQDQFWKAISSILTPEEIEFLCYRVNPEEGRHRTYKETGKVYGLNEREAQRRFTTITAKLTANEQIRNLAGKKDRQDVSITLQPSVSDTLFSFPLEESNTSYEYTAAVESAPETVRTDNPESNKSENIIQDFITRISRYLEEHPDAFPDD